MLLIRYYPAAWMVINREAEIFHSRLLSFLRRCYSDGLRLSAQLRRRARISGSFGSSKPRRRHFSFPRCWTAIMLEAHILPPLALCQAIRC